MENLQRELPRPRRLALLEALDGLTGVNIYL